MRLSRYNVYVPYESGNIVYNTMTYQIGYIEGDLHSACENVDQNSYNGLLIDDKLDEKERMKQHLKTRFDNDGMYRIELMTTQRCNLACSYCYQQTDDFTRIDMTEEIIDQSIAFINGLDLPSTVTFYGGEPMLFLDKIKYICSRLKNVARYSIITNGTNLTYQHALQLVDCGITHCQITLDGLKKDHDKQRKYPDGKGTFDEILSNIITAASTGLKITIRTNVFQQSKADLQAFYLLFYKNDLYKKFSFSISDVIGAPSDRNESISSLLFRFLRMGYDINCPVTVPCQISSGKSYVIDSNGYIYPCMYFAGVDSEKSIGHVQTGINAIKQGFYMDLDPWRDCLDCCYVGICAGGCRIRDTDLNMKYCQKKLFSSVLREEIKQLYLQSQRI